jgi:hypothetical protein
VTANIAVGDPNMVTAIRESRSANDSGRHGGHRGGFSPWGPFVGIYPVLLMKALCFALFACALTADRLTAAARTPHLGYSLQ